MYHIRVRHNGDNRGQGEKNVVDLDLDLDLSLFRAQGGTIYIMICNKVHYKTEMRDLIWRY